MKKTLIVFVAVFLSGICISATGQIVNKGYNTPAMKAFVAGKTYALLTNDENFNDWFQHALLRQWLVSSIEFVPASRLDSLILSDQNFFLFAQVKDEKSGAMRLLTADDMTKKKEFFIVLSQGGYKQSKYLFTTSTTGPKIIGSFRYDPARSALTAGMLEGELMLSLMNQSIQTILERQIKSEVKDSVKWVITDEYSRQIGDKTLLILRSYNDGSISHEDNPIITDKVLEDYPYEYEVIDKESVEARLDDASGSFCYLFFYFPTPHFKTTDDCGDILVYDPTAKKFIYFDDNINGPWFEKWKMKALASAIKKN